MANQDLMEFRRIPERPESGRKRLGEVLILSDFIEIWTKHVFYHQE